MNNLSASLLTINDDVFSLVLRAVDCPASCIMLAGTCKGVFERVRGQYPQYFKEMTTVELIDIAIASGQIAILKYVRNGRKLNRGHMRHAVKNGRLEMLKYLIQKCTRYDNIPTTAAEYGHVHILEWYMDEYAIRGYEVREALSSAAENGHLGTIEYFFDKYDRSILDYGDDVVIRPAVCNGHLHIVKYLVQQGHILTENLFYAAAINGKIDIVDYFVQEGWQITGRIVEGAVCSKLPEMIEWIMDRVPRWMIAGQMEWIMRTHNFSLLSRLLDEGFILPRNVGEIAARFCTLDMMKFVHGLGAYWTPEAYSWVFHQDTDPSEKVAYLAAVGCPMDSTVCRMPAETGNMPIVEYLVGHGAEFDDMSMFMAAYRQRHAVMKYAQSLGYDVRTMVIRASYSAVLRMGKPKDVRKWINTVKYL